jgi:hypothetical protein
LSRAVSISTGRLRLCRRSAAQHAEAVDAGQHQVQQHQVVVAAGGQPPAFDAVVRQVDDMAVLAQALVQVLGELGFVFDHQKRMAHRCRGLRLRRSPRPGSDDPRRTERPLIAPSDPG